MAIDLYAELSHYRDSPDLNSGLRAFLDLSWADMWIGNGGFIGLWQTRAATIRRLPEAAQRTGAPVFAALFRDANRVLPAGALDSYDALHDWLDGDHDVTFAPLVDDLDARRRPRRGHRSLRPRQPGRLPPIQSLKNANVRAA